MKQYLDILKHVLENGKEKSPVRRNANGVWEPVDGGVKTLACPNVLFSHDMSEGFPLLTTKKMGIKSIASELEFFIKGLSDKRWLQERNNHIWDSWCSPMQFHESIKDKKEWQRLNPDLGSIYSVQWRNFNGEYTPIPFAYANFDKTLDHYYDHCNDFVGTSYESNKYGRFIVKEEGEVRDNSGKKTYTIKFYNTNAENHNIRKGDILLGNVKDVYFPSICGVACHGIPNKDIFTPKQYKSLKNTWCGMINRCYEQTRNEYKNYGGRGVYVDNRWLVFEYFLEDVTKLPNWNLKVNNWGDYSLDKDLHDQKKYGPDSCLWLNISHQCSNTRNQVCFQATSPDGIVCYGENLTWFGEKHDLDASQICKCIKGKLDSCKGWTFKEVKKEKEAGYDQFKNLVNTLRQNPNDRRQVVMAWNPNALDEQALPACHTGFIVTVIDGKLNLFFSMRSADLALGVPYNIASYALLMTLLAKDAGLGVGNLSGMLVDCHIYENHIESAEEQIKRSPRPLPNLDIVRSPGQFDIFNWTYEDVVLTNYNPHGKINMGSVTV